jgi:hypothetical protein
VSPESIYQTPRAFRAALTDRINQRAKTGPWTVQQLQRQFAYDRLLERLYLVDDGWIVKGAVALMARELGVRGSLDIDVYREVSKDVAVADLQKAVTLDIDWMNFELGSPEPINDDKAARMKVRTIIGGSTWAEFSVDLVGADLRMTGQPDEVPPLAQGVMPDVGQRGYRVYPLVDHVADKVAATFELYGPSRRPSTRYRDLIDLVAISMGATIDAAEQLAALRSEFERRGLAWPGRFIVPDEPTWQSGYEAEARRSLLTTAVTLNKALAVVCPFIDPLLDKSASGQWRDGVWRTNALRD